MTANTERRKKHRKQPRNVLYVELEYANGGMMRDLSEEGFALRVKRPLRAGGKTQFAFLLDETTRISGEGRIVWVKEDGCVAGIEFCGISRKTREQIREWLGGTDRLATREPKVPATSDPEPPALETPRDETRQAIPRAVLPAVEGAENSLSAEPNVAPIGQAQPTWITDLAEDLKGKASAPSPDMHTELCDVTAERPPVAALEPLPTETAIEPLPALLPETDFNEMASVHPPGRFRVVRAIGMMLLLILIASGVVYHYQVGRALIWLGQIIAGEEVTRVPQSSIAEPRAPTTPKPETKEPLGSPGAPDSSATPSQEGNGPRETQAATASKVIETPPILAVAPSSSAKASSAPMPPPSAQQDRIPAPNNSTETARDTGQQEYQQAEEILRRKGDEVELAVAVRLLWVGVEKGNADAEVALAGLYRQGKGVAKNCDQARVLLSAAARKGSAEGQKHLDELVREGCE